MLAQTPSFKTYLKRRQAIIDSGQLEEEDESPTSLLFNEKTFYHVFVKDMLEAEREVIIYSPFVSKFRSDFFRKTMEKLKRRNVNVFIFTRPLEEHDLLMRSEITCALREYEEAGASIFYLEGHIHEKVAIIDRKILWEGSLNILSQRTSREIMRRIPYEDSALEIIKYLGLGKKLAEDYKLKYEKLCHNLIDKSQWNSKQKLRVFLLGLSIPLIIWWLLAASRVMILLLKSIDILNK